MGVKIVMDSASDIRLGYANEQGIGFAPLKTILAGKEYRDGIDVQPEEFYDKLKANKELASTSQVSVAEWTDLFANAIAEGDDVLAITISSGLSGTYQSARIAAGEFPGRVFVVDSLNATAGEQVLMHHALRMRDEGKSAKEIFEELEELKHRVALFVRVETLEYLKRGGRISKTAALVGGMLHFMPVLTLDSTGKLESVGKARGAKMSHKLLNDSIAARGGIDFDEAVCITYAGDEKDGTLDAYLQDSSAVYGANADKLHIGQLGCVIGTHTGPGAIVVAFAVKQH